ncbi:MAG TPA: histidine kinase dimerization/phospho-acceptor domain-containing protein, partial [Candidatus Binataceae bacterium]|nr:histidine kinase dimerization/phospho-acceptor domain-containing protein [Candidatus Binataceae bacterium]
MRAGTRAASDVMLNQAVSEIAALAPRAEHPARPRYIAVLKPLAALAAKIDSLREACVQVPEEPELRARFLDELRQQTLTRGRTACLIAIALMPAVAIAELGSGLSLKAAVCANLAMLLGAQVIMLYLKTGAGRRRPEPSLLFGFLACGLLIDLMVYASGGFTSPYYGMLNLLSLTVALLMPWEFRYSLAVFFLPMGLYFSIGDLNRIAGDEHTRSIHLLLLILTALIALTSDLILRRARLTGFLQRHRLLQAVAYRDALVARVSHELRTPLTVMLGYTELLQGDVAETHPEHKATFERIARNADDLNRLIDEMLMLSELRGGCLGTSNESVDLGDFTQALAIEFAPLFEKHQLQLKAQSSSAPVATVTDPRLLR